MDELSRIRIDRLNYKDADISLLRLDLIDPVVSGNKWFKLKYNLLEAKREGFTKVLTFGGAYSNHIYATAGACTKLGLDCVGIIRGEETLPLNDTLKFARDQGMSIDYLNRSDYRRKTERGIIDQLVKKHGRFYLIPEGGSNKLAVQGTSEIPQLTNEKYDVWAVPVGTGGTMAGIISKISSSSEIYGFSALKGAIDLDVQINDLLSNTAKTNSCWRIIHDYHFGGYAKVTEELFDFIKMFKENYNVILDPIYTSKMMFGLFDRIDRGFYKNKTILAIHTGGLQGWNGIKQRYSFIPDSFSLD